MEIDTRKNYSADEVATYLGMTVEHVRRLIRTGQLAAFKVGAAGNWRVPGNSILNVMKWNDKPQ
jgi:excisionase family DNA binding protein